MVIFYLYELHFILFCVSSIYYYFYYQKYRKHLYIGQFNESSTINLIDINYVRICKLKILLVSPRSLFDFGLGDRPHNFILFLFFEEIKLFRHEEYYFVYILIVINNQNIGLLNIYLVLTYSLIEQIDAKYKTLARASLLNIVTLNLLLIYLFT